jgi:protein-tyrosine phosphatase
MLNGQDLVMMQRSTLFRMEAGSTGSDHELNGSRASDAVRHRAPLETAAWGRGKRARTWVKRLLPSALLLAFQTAAQLRSASKSSYQRLGSVVRAWRRAGKKPMLPDKIARVLFVCHGNIMRSPVAEAMLKRELFKLGVASLKVSSAGLHAVAGRSADPRALSVSREFGVSLVQHRSQLLTARLVDASDLVLVMDIVNAAEFLLLYPRAKAKLFLLRQFSRHNQEQGRDIPDPYPGDDEDMRGCCRMLEDCVAGLANGLAAEQGKAGESFITGYGN